MDPVLLIGLGGTGREVLLRIRRRFFEAGWQSQPWIAYLWIDTEVSVENSGMSKSMLNDYIARRIAFRKDSEEVCDIGLDRQSIVDHLMNQKSAWRNITEWISHNLLIYACADQDGYTNGLTAGARQIPTLGRLALFYHAGKVRQKLEHQLGRLDAFRTWLGNPNQVDQLGVSQNLTTQQANQLRQAFGGPNVQPKTMIVGSLAGGTGAGLCVDVAAMLRLPAQGGNQAAPFLQDPGFLGAMPITGYFLLPSAFCRDDRSRPNNENKEFWANFNRDRVRANGYAMLQELERVSLPRLGKDQFLSGQPEAGRLRASWLFGPNPEEAPEIDAPVFNSYFLFDGSGQGATALNKIEANYELIGNIIFNDLVPGGQGMGTVLSDLANAVTYIYPHLEKSVASPKDNQPWWTDIYSFRPATAGCARVTFDIPRLQTMASYLLVDRAMKAWRGEEYFNDAIADPKHPDHPDALRLKTSVTTRIDHELDSFQSTPAGAAHPVRRKWEDLVPELYQWSWTLKRNGQMQEEKVKDGLERMRWTDKVPSLSLREHVTYVSHPERQPKWDATSLTNLMRTYYLADTQFRLSHILTSLISRPPLETFEHLLAPQNQYVLQGGLAAADLLLGPSDIDFSTGARAAAARYRALEAQAQTEAGNLLPDLRKNAALADAYLAHCKAAAGDWFVHVDTVDHIKTEARKCYEQAHAMLMEYCAKIQLQKRHGALAAAYEDLARQEQGTILHAMLAKWRLQAGQARNYLRMFLAETERIISDFQAFGLQAESIDPLTKRLFPDLHTNTNALEGELKKIFAGAYDEALRKLQNGIVAALARLTGDRRILLRIPGNAPPLQGLLDLGESESLAKINGNAPDIPFDDQLNAVVEQARAEPMLDNLLAKASLAQEIGKDPALIDFLQLQSQCRLALHADSNGQPSRHPLDVVYYGNQNPVPQRHKHVIAPPGVPCPRGFIQGGGNRPDEVLAFQFEGKIPLPNIIELNAWYPLYAANRAENLHFVNPKNGYLPIHRIASEDQGKDIAELYQTVILGIILGQFRPNSPADHDRYFEFRIDLDHGLPRTLDGAVSLPDIVRELANGGGLESQRPIIASRNRQILKDLGPNALVALHLILAYNLCFVAPRDIKAPRGRNMDDPQELVIMRLLHQLESEVATRFFDSNGRSMRLIHNQSAEFAPARDYLRDFLFHFAEFVPTRLALRHGINGLRWEETSPLLCLRTQIAAYRADKPDEDLLMRRAGKIGETYPIAELLELRAPWVRFRAEDCDALWAMHESLAGAGALMRPVAPGQPAQRDGGDPWSEAMRRAEAVVRDPSLYCKVLQSNQFLAAQQAKELSEKRRQIALEWAQSDGGARPVKWPQTWPHQVALAMSS